MIFYRYLIEKKRFYGVVSYSHTNLAAVYRSAPSLPIPNLQFMFIGEYIGGAP